MAAARQTGRRPADQPGAGRQDMWLALKQVQGAFTVSDIAKATKIHRTSVLRYLRALSAAGYLETTPVPNGLASSWRLVRDVGHHAPRVHYDGSAVTHGVVSQQIWQAMVGLKTFDYRELIQGASIEIKEATAKDYCKRLLAAGYLRVEVKANPHTDRIARYKLIRPSGPKAPQIQRVRQVFDPNTGAVYAAEGGL